MPRNGSARMTTASKVAIGKPSRPTRASICSRSWSTSRWLPSMTAVRRLDDVVAKEGSESRLRARALAVKIGIAAWSTDLAATREMLVEPIAMAEELGDLHTVAAAKTAALWGYILPEPEIAEARCAEAV